MRHSLVVFFLILAVGFADKTTDFDDCDPHCDNHYRNCDPPGDLSSDKPDEVIDCTKNFYLRSCPLKCGLCKACDFKTAIEEIQKDLGDVKDSVNDLESEVEKNYDDLKDDLKEQEDDLEKAEKEFDESQDQQDDKLEANEEDISRLFDLMGSLGVNTKQCKEDKDCHTGGQFFSQHLHCKKLHFFHLLRGFLGKLSPHIGFVQYLLKSGTFTCVTNLLRK